MKAAGKTVALTDGNTTEMEIPLRGSRTPGALFRFNERLTSIADRPMNESDMTELRNELNNIVQRDESIHGLLLARIVELSLFSAGTYADNCEFEAVGDLLVNPALVDIFVRGNIHPIPKDRHARLSDQVMRFAGNSDSFDWLNRNTLLRIRKQALLPALYEELETSGLLARDYLLSISHRMCRVSDTVAFLSAWQTCSAVDLHHKLSVSSPAERAFVKNNLCRFGLSVFYEIGSDIAGIERGNVDCRFLRRKPLQWAGIRYNETLHMDRTAAAANRMQ
ncbi:MAG: hypothetical protein V2B19_31785 [Pseudomonadota bacterium]